DGKNLRFRKAVIATGTRAAALPLPGLAEAGYLTNETVFSLTALPQRLAVIGAGPIGSELAQAFARFRAQVSLLEVTPQILIREDRDAAARIQDALEQDGVSIFLGVQHSCGENSGGGKADDRGAERAEPRTARRCHPPGGRSRPQCRRAEPRSRRRG